jgi:hypothetical protein
VVAAAGCCPGTGHGCSCSGVHLHNSLQLPSHRRGCGHVCRPVLRGGCHHCMHRVLRYHGSQVGTHTHHGTEWPESQECMVQGGICATTPVCVALWETGDEGRRGQGGHSGAERTLHKPSISNPTTHKPSCPFIRPALCSSRPSVRPQRCPWMVAARSLFQGGGGVGGKQNAHHHVRFTCWMGARGQVGVRWRCGVGPPGPVHRVGAASRGHLLHAHNHRHVHVPGASPLHVPVCMYVCVVRWGGDALNPCG